MLEKYFSVQSTTVSEISSFVGHPVSILQNRSEGKQYIDKRKKLEHQLEINPPQVVLLIGLDR